MLPHTGARASCAKTVCKKADRLLSGRCRVHTPKAYTEHWQARRGRTVSTDGVPGNIVSAVCPLLPHHFLLHQCCWETGVQERHEDPTQSGGWVCRGASENASLFLLPHVSDLTWLKRLHFLICKMKFIHSLFVQLIFFECIPYAGNRG